MKKNTNTVTPLSDLTGMKRAEVCEIASSAFETGRKAYIVAGKCCVAINQKLRKGESLYKILRKAGLKDSQIANGQQLAKAYQAIVETGKKDESWFDETLNYTLAVAFNALTRKNPAMADRHLDEPEEWASLADTGMTRSDHAEFLARKEAEEAEAKAKAEAEAEAPEVDEEEAEEASEAAEESTETETPTEESESSEEVEAAPATDTEEAPASEEPTEESEPEAETSGEESETGKVTHIDKMPALTNALTRVDEIALEIARDQPEKAAAAKAEIERVLTAVKSVLETAIETEEAEQQVANG